MAADFND